MTPYLGLLESVFRPAFGCWPYIMYFDQLLDAHHTRISYHKILTNFYFWYFQIVFKGQQDSGYFRVNLKIIGQTIFAKNGSILVASLLSFKTV